MTGDWHLKGSINSRFTESGAGKTPAFFILE